MVQKIRKMIALIILLISPLFLTIACNTKQNNLFNYDYKITIASSMPETWPQYQAFKKIVNDYNKYERNRKNFMEVVFLSKKDVKTDNLNNKINKLILARSNDIPNILLDGDFGQIYQLAAFDKLLNLKSNTLDASHFNSYFVKGLTSLNIKNYQEQGLYAGPILALANNSIVINKPVLKTIFTLMAHHGAIVEANKSNPIISEINANKTNLATQKNLISGKYDGVRDVALPANLWVDNGNLKNDLAGYKINDKIFKTYKKFYAFIEKAYESLQLKSPLYIYGSGVLYDYLTLLDSERQSLSATNPLFNKLGSGKYNFPFLNSTSAQTKIADAFNKLIKLAKKGYGAYPENYNIVGLRNGQQGITSHFSVSARYSYQSKVFGDYTNNGFNFDDILYLPSLDKWNEDTIYSSRQLTSWFLMGIRTSTLKDKAAKTFIDFLYNGQMTNDVAAFASKPRKVTDFLQWESSYATPTTDSLNIKTKYSSVYNKISDPNHKYEAIYRGLKNLKDSMQNPSILRNYNGNQYTGKLLDIIKKTLTTALKNAKKWDGKRFVQELLNNKSDFEY